MKWVTIKKIVMALVLCSVRYTWAMDNGAGAGAFPLTDACNLAATQEHAKGFVPPLSRLIARSLIVQNRAIDTLLPCVRTEVERERCFLENIVDVNRELEQHPKVYDRIRGLGQTGEKLCFALSFMRAIEKGECSLRLAQYYLSSGASLGQRQELERQFGKLPTPIHVAASRGLVDLVAVLLHHEGENEVNSVGCDLQITPLHAAADPSFPRFESLQKKKKKRGREFFHKRRKFLHTPEVVADLVATTQLLLEHDANVDALDIFGRTPLFIAAGNDLLPIVRLLLEHGASLRIRSDFAGHGDTLLCNAIGEKAYDVVRFLLGRPADGSDEGGAGQALVDVNEAGNGRAPFNDTPLRRAVRIGDSKLVELLISVGASIDASANLEDALRLKPEIEVVWQLHAAGAEVATLPRSSVQRAFSLLTRKGRERRRLEQQLFENYQAARAREEEAEEGNGGRADEPENPRGDVGAGAGPA